MPVAHRVLSLLKRRHVPYGVVGHPHTSSSAESAAAAHVPGDQVAKAVVLRDDKGYVLAVIPSTHRVTPGALESALSRDLQMATEDELATIFLDCDRGAIPPIGVAYGLPTVVDETLAEQPEVFFEAGDHRRLIRVSHSGFDALTREAVHGTFSKHI
jgi:Ala-tRNA(Pro) deacylase